MSLIVKRRDLFKATALSSRHRRRGTVMCSQY